MEIKSFGGQDQDDANSWCVAGDNNECQPPRHTPRLMQYARLLAIFFGLYFQARVLMVRNYILSWRLQLCELPLVYLKIEIFIVRLSVGLPLAECWPSEKPASGKQI